MITQTVEEYLDSLPSNIKILKLRNKNLVKLPDLTRFTKLKELDCSNNNLTTIDNLPYYLHELVCNNNKIKNLDNLPIRLRRLYCRNNCIIRLDKLPPLLDILDCCNNNIAELDNLPNNVRILYCEGNHIKKFNNLPNRLQYLFCRHGLSSYDYYYTKWDDEHDHAISTAILWKEIVFNKKVKLFIKNRNARIIQNIWNKYWYEPYRFEQIDNKIIAYCRSQEYYFKQL